MKVLRVFLGMAAMVAATIVSATPLNWNGSTYQIVLASKDTGDAISIFWEEISEPGGPPLHIHGNEDETFYALTGRVKFMLNGEEKVLEKGEAAYIPKGSEHAFATTEPKSQMLVILTPGGFEEFFKEMATEGLHIPQDMPRIGEIAAKYNMQFTGPPLPVE